MANLSMSATVELATKNQAPKEVKELILDNCRSSAIDGLTDKFEELEVLSINNAGLATLKGFPSYPKLKILELNDNKLTGELEYLKGCSEIVSLKICNNRIADLTALEPLKLLPNLVSLDLDECPITKTDKYRDVVMAALSKITFLDGVDRDGNLEPESDEDYEFDEDEDVDSEEDDGEDDDGEEGDGEDEKGDDNEEGEDNAEDEPEEPEEEDDSLPAAKRTKLDTEDSCETNGVEPTEDTKS